MRVTDLYSKKAPVVSMEFFPRRDEGFVPHPESFSYASELIGFIRERYAFTLGCAGCPEGHLEAESLDKEIAFLKKKQDSGAEYVVAQYCYDNRFFSITWKSAGRRA